MHEIHNQLLSLSAIKPQISIVDEIISDLDNIIDITENNKKLKKFNKQWFKKYGLLIAAAIVLFVPITITINQNFNLTSNDDKSYFSMAVQEDSAMEVEDRTVKNVDGNTGEKLAYGIQMPLQADYVLPYIIEIENNQLIIYQDEQIIYTSKTWADDLNVDYYLLDENEIIYSLFSKDNVLIGSYKIDLFEKTEEKVG